MTGQAAPNTLDVVKAGLESAKCAVVLLTGDDVAKLRPEFEEESFQFQPRANVLFEAGWAFAKGGHERTVLVAFQKLRPFSDLTGINVLELNDSAVARKHFVERLRAAGCKPDDSGSDYLRPEVTGSFDLKFDERQRNIVLERGDFTEFIVDSSLSHSINNLELHKDLCDYLSTGDRTDLKYNYLGTLCAANWLDLSEDPTYGHSDLVEVIKSNRETIIESAQLTNSAVDFVSLGPGDGVIDKYLLFEMQRRCDLRHYYPIDLSFELLQKAVMEILDTRWVLKTFRVKAIHGDFTRLSVYRPVFNFDPAPNFFCLIGYSFGNHNEAELLGKLREGMGAGDLLLLDVRLHQLGQVGTKRLNDQTTQTIVVNYHHALNNRFAFGPVETVTVCDFDSVEFLYDVTYQPHICTECSQCGDLLQERQHQISAQQQEAESQQTYLTVTTLYDFASLADWFPSKGFQLVWSKAVAQTGLFLVRKAVD
jgi:predicted nucleotide-binding protein with TIR-like domain/histidine-specific SAM-dependent methyltransferase